MATESDQRLFRGRRLAGAAAAGVVLAGFASIVWHAYDVGQGSGSIETTPIIAADQAPVKTRPDDPGGMDVPHRDKLIYNRLDPAAGDDETVENLLPPPEALLPAPSEKSPAENAPANADTAPEPAEEVAPSRITPAQTDSARAPSIRENVPPAAPEIAARPPEPAPAAPEAPAWESAQAANLATSARVQLLSVRSRSAALEAWTRVLASQEDLLGNLSPHVERAEIAGKGVFYRLQAGPLPDKAAAERLCRELNARDQGCLAVGGG